MFNSLKEKEVGFSQLFSMSKEVYKKNIKTMIFILILLFLPINIIFGVLNNFMANSVSSINIDILLENIENIGMNALPKEYIIYNFLYMIVQLFFEPLGIMAVAYVTYKYVFNESINYKQAISRSLEKGGMFLVSAFIYILFIFIGMSFIFPGIYIGIAGYFYMYAIVIDNKNPFSAIIYSLKTVKNRWFKTCAYLIIIGICKYSISVLMSYIFAGVIDQNIFIGTVLIQTANQFFNIVFYCLITLMYINRKLIIENK